MARKVTVIICTYNRVESLVTTLQCVSAIDVPSGWECEVLVVDNNSTDSTGEAVRGFVDKGFSSLRYLHEPQQGLSHARNTGIREAAGEIIIFTDDDVIVEKDWLLRIVHTFTEHDADCVGGKILPVWPGKRPLWLSKRNENILAVLDYGDELKKMTIEDEPLFGANFAFTKKMLDKAGYFNTALGRKGSKLYCSEDTDMFARIFAAGGRVFYEPRAVVHHIIGAHRLEKRYFRKWHYDAGEGLGFSLGAYTRRNVFGVPYYIVRETLEAIGRYLGAVLTLKPDNIFYREQKVIFYLAFIRSRVKVHSSNGGGIYGVRSR